MVALDLRRQGRHRGSFDGSQFRLHRAIFVAAKALRLRLQAGKRPPRSRLGPLHSKHGRLQFLHPRHSCSRRRAGPARRRRWKVRAYRKVGIRAPSFTVSFGWRKKSSFRVAGWLRPCCLRMYGVFSPSPRGRRWSRRIPSEGREWSFPEVPPPLSAARTRETHSLYYARTLAIELAKVKPAAYIATLRARADGELGVKSRRVDLGIACRTMGPCPSPR